MTEYVTYNHDWAYYIETESFDMHKLQGKAPVGSIILTKEKEDLDTGMTVTVTKYFIAKKGGVEPLGGKKEASQVIADLMLAKMRKSGKMISGVSVKKEYANGNVDLLFVASDYDKFTLKIKKDMTKSPPIDFLESLDKAGKKKFSPSDEWKAERAKSGRASCRTCGARIAKDEVRIGEPSYFQDHKSYKWHHLKCIKDNIWGIPENMLEGYGALDSDAKDILKKALWE
jgi:hypothetical protein